MSYRNKTCVAFASEDIHLYRLMEARRDNEKIDFSFFDAHDLYVARDTSLPGTIGRNLRERLTNAKQIVLIGTADAKKKGGRPHHARCERLRLGLGHPRLRVLPAER